MMEAALDGTITTSTETMCLATYSRLAGSQAFIFLARAKAESDTGARSDWPTVAANLLFALQLSMALPGPHNKPEVSNMISTITDLTQSFLDWRPQPMLPTGYLAFNLTIDGILWCLPAIYTWSQLNGDGSHNIPKSLIIHLGTPDAQPIDKVLIAEKMDLSGYGPSLSYRDSNTRDDWRLHAGCHHLLWKRARSDRGSLAQACRYHKAVGVPQTFKWLACLTYYIGVVQVINYSGWLMRFLFPPPSCRTSSGSRLSRHFSFGRTASTR